MRLTLFILVGMILGVPGCGKLVAVKGSGNITTEKREATAFSKVEAGGAVTVVLTVGDPTSVEVTTDDNLQSHILTSVEGDTLRIQMKGSISPSKGLTIKVSTPTLTDLGVGGASTAKVAGVKADAFSLSLSGASKATVSGQVNELDVECSGASHVEAKGLDAEKVQANASGASTIEVKATTELEGTASGASTILYTGGPSKLTTNISGASSIKASGP
jgi:hypothetical protein